MNNDNNVLFSEISSRFYKLDIQEVMIGELEDPTRKHGEQVRTQGQERLRLDSLDCQATERSTPATQPIMELFVSNQIWPETDAST